METPKGTKHTTAGPLPPASANAPDPQHAGVLSRLIELVSTGDRSAFGRLYELTVKRVHGLARRVLIDPDLAEDATQETYLQVWQNAAKFNPDTGSALAWLMTIAHRRAVDKVRSAQSATGREARYGAASQEIEHDDVADAVGSRLEAEAVNDCLGTLTDMQQESVRLAYYGGLTYREVAGKLGAAVPTIKSRIRDGLIRLKNCLEVN